MKFLLIDKAEGDIYLNMANVSSKDGFELYATAHTWFTETSGLGLAEHARKLMNQNPATSEHGIAERLQAKDNALRSLTKRGPHAGQGRLRSS